MREYVPYGQITAAFRDTFLVLLPLYVPKAHEAAGTKVRTKTDNTPVTDLDNYTLQCLRDLIVTRFPKDRTIGEEDKKSPEEMARILADDVNRYWTIDGLDGTWHYVRGTNSYGAMVSLRMGNHILYSVIFRPVDMALRGTGFFVAMSGYGAWEWCADHQDYHQLFTARPGSLERVTVLLEGSSKKFFEGQVASLGRKVTTRPSLSSCIAATTIARGDATALVTRGNKPWDTWPAIGIIEGAGGVVTDYRGNRRKLSDCGDMIAAASAEDIPGLVKLLNP